MRHQGLALETLCPFVTEYSYSLGKPIPTPHLDGDDGFSALKRNHNHFDWQSLNVNGHIWMATIASAPLEKNHNPLRLLAATKRPADAIPTQRCSAGTGPTTCRLVSNFDDKHNSSSSFASRRKTSFSDAFFLLQGLENNVGRTRGPSSFNDAEDGVFLESLIQPRNH